MMMDHIDVPIGLILLVGPPAAGKSTFAAALIAGGQLDPDGVVSCDAIRAELFGAKVDVDDDPSVFGEMDRRVLARLAAGLVAVVDATNVMPPARLRMIAWARQCGSPVSALRFGVAEEVLSRRNATRVGHQRVPTSEVLRYAAVAAGRTARAQLISEGVEVVVDVPGEAEGFSAAEAAAMVRLGP
jgi:predicted kinase